MKEQIWQSAGKLPSLTEMEETYYQRLLKLLDARFGGDHFMMNSFAPTLYTDLRELNLRKAANTEGVKDETTG